MTYYDLGTYSRAITTTSPEAQLWFDRGLIWVCAYNHEEGIKCFKKALEHDPDWLRPTELGRRFTNDVIGLFLP